MIIAEIAQAHDGSLGAAHAFIDALSTTGIDIVKFQTHIADAESSIYEPFRVKFSRQDDTRMDYWRRMEFSRNEWQGLKLHCEDAGMEFMSTPFSIAAVDLLEEIGVTRYKVGSGEITNHLLLTKIGQTGKPCILSSGMSNYTELESAVELLKKYDTDISLMQCTTAYPTRPEEWGLNVIGELKEKFGLPTGFSDHSGDIYACLAAAALGAWLFEFHVVFDKRQFGPDAPASITIDQVSNLVQGIRDIQTSLNNPIDKSNNERFFDLKTIFEKSLAVNKTLPEGHTISIDDLETKKPREQGISASRFKKVIGKSTTRALDQWAFLSAKDVDGYND